MEYVIALTGATGFIGNRIARRLVADGCKLQALTRTTSDRSRLSGLNIHWVEGALEDLDSLKRLVNGVDAVIHCAGAVRGATQAHFDRLNVDGAARLVQAVSEQHPVPRFLLISSLAAREPEISPYASSKRQGEVVLAAKSGQIPWTVLRPPAVYGPGDREMLPLMQWMLRGIAFILVVVMFVWAFRDYPKGHIIRLGASFSMILITTEALVGAGLVLFEWVAQDASVGRAISIVVHLINTFLLLAALSLNAWWASGGQPFSLRGNRSLTWLLLLGILGTIVIGASGALTALGDTLFPVTSLADGIRQDFTPTAHFLLRLRLLHPTIAVIVGIYLMVMSGFIRMRKSNKPIQNLAYALSLIVLVQLVAGLINVLLLAPVWMQIVHLLLADGVWIILILLTASVLAEEENAIHKLEASENIPGLIR